MLQRLDSAIPRRVAPTQRSRAGSTRAWRASLLALVASSLGACASLPTGATAFGGARYAAIVRPTALGPSPFFAQCMANNTLAQSPMYASNIAIGDSTLAATIIRLRQFSPAFDSAMTAIEQSGIPTVIGTQRQLKDQLPPGYAQAGGWQAVTAFYPLAPPGVPGRRIEHIAVIVRLSGLESSLRTPQDTATFNRYLEQVLAHEIYGHTMPQIAFGKTAPIACKDPTDGADWYSACVMQRQRHVAAEMTQARGTFALAATH